MKTQTLALWILAVALGAQAQQGARNGEWRFYGGDAGSTKYSPLDQINASNVKDLKIVWEWKAQNFGKRPDINWEVTPLEVGGVLYLTVGTRRDVVAVDAVTGETLWMYRLDEGARGAVVARTVNRGLAYWSDGKGDNRIVLITPGFQLVELNAKNWTADRGVRQGRHDRPHPGAGPRRGEAGDNRVEFAGHRDSRHRGGGRGLAGRHRATLEDNVPGYIRGFDVRTGQKLWTFRTIPHEGEFGVDTWENDSWKYTGNTGAWVPLSGDEELGYVYIPVEAPTGDFYGGTRPGNNLFSDSLVCLDARTGKRIWYYQLVHHDIWDWDIAAPPILLDVTVDGRKIKAVAQVTKQAFTFVFDRVTGQPVWPIVERPVPQSTVPGEKTAATQPFPTKPLPFDRQGTSIDDLIDFTPELRAEAIKIASKYKLGPLYTPPIMADDDGKIGLLLLPHHTGGGNWPGGAADPETGMLYVASLTNQDSLAMVVADPKRSDMGIVGGGARGRPTGPPEDTPRPAAKTNIGPQGLPLIKPPWGRITAIDLNTGDHAWMAANGEAPDYIKNHPAMKGIDLSNTGKPSRSLLMVTKTLLFAPEGNNLWTPAAGAGGNLLRILDKKTGKLIYQMELPAMATGVPMTYMVNDRQFVVLAIGAIGTPAELVALALP